MITAFIELFIIVNLISFVVTLILEIIDYLQKDKTDKEAIKFDEIMKYTANITRCISFNNEILNSILRGIAVFVCLLITPGILIGSKLANAVYNNMSKTK